MEARAPSQVKGGGGRKPSPFFIPHGGPEGAVPGTLFTYDITLRIRYETVT